MTNRDSETFEVAVIALLLLILTVTFVVALRLSDLLDALHGLTLGG